MGTPGRADQCKTVALWRVLCLAELEVELSLRLLCKKVQEKPDKCVERSGICIKIITLAYRLHLFRFQADSLSWQLFLGEAEHSCVQ